jgi:hypothetical protein
MDRMGISVGRNIFASTSLLDTSLFCQQSAESIEFNWLIGNSCAKMRPNSVDVIENNWVNNSLFSLSV